MFLSPWGAGGILYNVLFGEAPHDRSERGGIPRVEIYQKEGNLSFRYFFCSFDISSGNA